MGPLNIIGELQPCQRVRFDGAKNIAERVYVADLESQDETCRICITTRLSERQATKNVALIRATPLLAEALRAIADPEHYLTRHDVGGLRRLATEALQLLQTTDDAGGAGH